eukprot:TRINITY_DN15632_c0_g1_i1.p1 TRINITY_DN15632_c0_g1~~TRINITY_DN15632_c0_g1_i1.p1  ORF type:complete len:413 (-),score=46.90 TRINITY_DN15632_c0_g1_i1:88-1326(-)
MSDSEVHLRFETDLPDPFRIDATQYTIPSEAGVEQLNDIVNNVLALPKPETFDFLVNGKYLRTSLRQYREENDVSPEVTLVLWYVKPLPPPQEEQKCEHDEWVSAVAGDGTFYLSATFSGQVSFWSQTGDLLWKASIHERSIKGLAVLQPLTSSKQLYVTAAQDNLARICFGQKAIAECPHAASVEAVAAAPRGAQLATACWDGSVTLWDANVDIPVDEAERKHKKAKSDSTIQRMRATNKLSGHSGAVQCIIWPQPSMLISGGWDHTVRVWDPELQTNVRALANSDSVVQSVSYSLPGKLIASGHTDRIARVWDARIRDGPAMLMQLRKHKGFVTGVSWSPTESHLLATSSHDSSVCIWDVRASSAPVHTIGAHKGRSFCVHWASPDRIVSGGADNTMRIISIAAQRKAKK